MNDRTNRKYIFRFLCLLWMILIFFFSNKSGEASTRDSDFAAIWIYKNLISSDGIIGEYALSVIDTLKYPIRKSAHILEYTILGCLFTGSIADKNTSIKAMIFSFLFAAFYRATDEIHQLFVPGRAGLISDVMIDSCGIILGILIYCIISNLINSKRSNN